ncbi:MAG: hypothetical protein J3K34DRAFT_403061 [Monoraphidium minutum]|nr:MAG: hypothetical protein J3K34DRAFT_403061 [Monoraphidium minutum]
MAPLVRGILLLLVPSVAIAFPQYFAVEYAPQAATPCLAHPERPRGAHQAPQLDPSIEFTVTDAAGTPAAAVCPGATYGVRVAFPEPRHMLTTATAGTLGPAAAAAGVDQTLPPGVAAACPNRFVYGAPGGSLPLDAYPLSLSLPCGAVPPEGMTLRVTSASGMASPYFTSNATLPLAAGCPPCAPTLPPATAPAPAAAAP